MQINNKRITNACRSVVWPAAALGLGLSAPVLAQGSGQSSAVVEEIIVSARRQEESSQDIPIAITVVDQQTMANSNVFSSAELKQFTPSLAVNPRFGPDQATFAIRGFTQELRTTASVGFYFAEVVAPRGGGSVTAGDGAGPGSFFDLQNVLVLKGPQGTLFGRNTTGGAILLTPQEPTSQLEGYLEGAAGDYDMQRIQGVINVPISETVRARFGVDTMKRDGHLRNVSGIGPSELGNTDYVAARASVVWEVSDALQNYTILSYSDSENTGVASSLFDCKPGLTLFNMGCPAQLAHQGRDFYMLESLMANPVSEQKQWQLINTTTWEVHDDLTIKNIVAYADLEQINRTAVYGMNYDYYGIGSYGFVESNSPPGVPTNSQVSFVEELQFQGYAMDGDLTWQAGIYFENSMPDGISGSQSIGQVFCSSVDQANPANSTCIDVPRNHFLNSLGIDIIGAQFGPNGYGAITRTQGEVEYVNNAIYSEMTYDINDQWKVTAGLRYTRDKAIGQSRSQMWNGYSYLGAPATPSVAGNTQCLYSGNGATLANGCKDNVDQTSEAVTGLIDVDYFLTQDVMLYAKYARGYRMGSVNVFGGDGFREFNPEHVDAYELGAKTTFGGPVPGTFNVSVFYNDLQDQQLQYGYLSGGLSTTAIVNAGTSVIQGFEVETSLMLLEDLMLNVSYTYLDTELKEMVDPVAPAGVSLSPTSRPGDDLTFSPMHSVVAGLRYRLPLPVEVGDVHIGGTYSYTDEQNSTAPEYVDGNGRLAGSPYATLDSYSLLNLNVNWNGIFGSRFDAGLFMTNALDEKYTTYVSGAYHNLGFETRQVGLPKMWGAKVRYNFGG